MFNSLDCPSRRTDVTPGKRVRASAIETSGKPPMSSADMASTTVSAKRLVFKDLITLPLKPLTWITSNSLSCSATASVS